MSDIFPKKHSDFQNEVALQILYFIKKMWFVWKLLGIAVNSHPSSIDVFIKLDVEITN